MKIAKIARLSCIFLIAMVTIYTTAMIATPACASATEVPQLILNGSFESGDAIPVFWKSSTWGDNDAKFSYPETGPEGSRAVGVTISRHTSGDAKWIYPGLATTEGSKYFYSEKFTANTATEIVVQYVDIHGVVTFERLDVLLRTYSWENYSTEIVIPANVKSFAIQHILPAVGTLKMDEVTLTTLQSGAETDSFDQGYVSLSFDDGWNSNFVNARPILNEAGVKASFYTLTEGLDINDITRSESDKRKSPLRLISDYINDCGHEQSPPGTYMHAGQLKTLLREGHEVGSHTASHMDLANIGPKEAIRQVTESGTKIRDLSLGQNLTFAYPYGASNKEVMRMVYDASYVGARGVNPGFNYTSSNRFALKAYTVTPDTTLEEVSGWIQHAKAKKAWLILIFHEIDDEQGAYSTSPEFLKAILYLINEYTLQTVTIAEGLEIMNQAQLRL